MAGHTVCPRCGARDSFLKGFLPETCVCQRCMSQLDWREIPGCGPDCTSAGPEAATGTTTPTYVAAPMAPASGDEDGEVAQECPPAASDVSADGAGASDGTGDDPWKV
jgi:hypothetical protein